MSDSTNQRVFDDKKTYQSPSQSVMLIGLMGSGKTVIGRMLAHAYGWDFADSDKTIEETSNLRITDIFDLFGEAKFREMERRVIGELITVQNTVISVGGGAFCQPDIRRAAKGNVTTIWLRATPAELLGRMDNLASRPLLAGDNPLGILEQLHKERFADYAQADIVVDTDKLSLRQSLAKVLAALS